MPTRKQTDKMAAPDDLSGKNIRQVNPGDNITIKKLQPILTKISADKEFAALVKRDFDKAIAPFHLSRDEVTALKKLL
jgi:hypothetical protein